MDRRENLLRLIAIIIGGAMVVAAFAGVLFVGRATQGANVRIAFVVADFLAPGDTLASNQITFENVSIDPGLASLYVTEDEIEEYLGKQIISPLTYGQALLKAHLISGQSRSRYASYLENPDNVILYIPVNAETTPRVAPGDKVDIWAVLGSAQGYQDLLDPTPTPTPFIVETLLPFETPGATPTGAPIQETVIPTDELTIEPTLTPTPTATSIVRFPMADLIVQGVLVIDVDTREAEEEGGQDRVRGLTIVVPRMLSTRLLFALRSGAQIIVGITSPFGSDPSSISPLPVPYDYEQFRIDARTKISEAARLGFFGPYMSGAWDAYLLAFAPDVYASIQATREAVLVENNRNALTRPYALPTLTPVPTRSR